MTFDRPIPHLVTASLELADRQTTTAPKLEAQRAATLEQHIAAIRAHLTTPEEQAFFDRAVEKMRANRPQDLERIAQFTVADAVAILRREMPRQMNTDDADARLDAIRAQITDAERAVIDRTVANLRELGAEGLEQLPRYVEETEAILRAWPDATEIKKLEPK